METLYYMFASKLSWLSNGMFEEGQQLNRTSDAEDLCDSFLADLPWSNGEKEAEVAQCSEADEAELSDEFETDENELCKYPVLHELERTGVSEEQTLHNNDNGVLKILNDNAEDNHITGGKFSRSANATYKTNLSRPYKPMPGISDDDATLSRSESKESSRKDGTEQPEYPMFKELEWTDIKRASKAGKMPRLCKWCHRWEDQPEDKYDKEDMVADKRFMFGNRTFFRKRKPFWAECVHCGFGLPKRTIRGSKTACLRKLFCKLRGQLTRDFSSSGKGTTGSCKWRNMWAVDCK